MPKQCRLSVHFKCQKSWEEWAHIAMEDIYQAMVCREHHPLYRTWCAKHRKTVEEHKREASLEARFKKGKESTNLKTNTKKSRSDSKRAEGMTAAASTGNTSLTVTGRHFLHKELAELQVAMIRNHQ